jgi:hypothetical protein
VVVKIFISWSGDASEYVARKLQHYLPRIIQGLTTFMSKTDIEKGTQGTAAIDDELRETDYCISCLTPDNLTNPWINFEAGAIAKHGPESRVWTVLINMDSTQLSDKHPLRRFQYAELKKRDFFDLLKSINKEIKKPPLSEDMLEEQFELLWDKIESDLNATPTIEMAPALIVSQKPTEQALIKDVFDMVRGLQREMASIQGGLSALTRPYYQRPYYQIKKEIKDSNPNIKSIATGMILDRVILSTPGFVRFEVRDNGFPDYVLFQKDEKKIGVHSLLLLSSLTSVYDLFSRFQKLVVEESLDRAYIIILSTSFDELHSIASDANLEMALGDNLRICLALITEQGLVEGFLLNEWHKDFPDSPTWPN